MPVSLKWLVGILAGLTLVAAGFVAGLLVKGKKQGLPLSREQLQQQFEELRHSRHDMRYHRIVLSSFLQSGDQERLYQYLKQYLEILPQVDDIPLCRNDVINALLVYYGQQASDHGIRFSANMELPERLKLPDQALVSLLGNLLENAVQACSAIRDREPYICVQGKLLNEAIVFKIENSCDEGHIQDLRSSKGIDHGLGLRSVRRTAEQYNGELEIAWENSVFSVWILLDPK